MSPQARGKLPPELAPLCKREMEAVIDQANIGRENEQIARLYCIDRMPQIDIAQELYLGRSTVQRRLPDILRKLQQTSKRFRN